MIKITVLAFYLLREQEVLPMAKRWKESVYEFAKAEVLEAGREEGRKEDRKMYRGTKVIT